MVSQEDLEMIMSTNENIHFGEKVDCKDINEVSLKHFINTQSFHNLIACNLVKIGIWLYSFLIGQMVMSGL